MPVYTANYIGLESFVLRVKALKAIAVSPEQDLFVEGCYYTYN